MLPQLSKMVVELTLILICSLGLKFLNVELCWRTTGYILTVLVS